MTEHKPPTVVDEVSIPPAQGADQAAATESRTASSSALPLIIGLLALILAIGLAVVAYFTWYEVQRLDRNQAGIETEVSDRIQPLRTSLDGMNRALEDERGAIEARIGKLDEDRQSLANRLNVLAALMGRSERGWTLAEVEYLLRIANQRLQLQRDLKTAEQALQAADGRLRDLADPHYHKVREQIGRDLEAVRAVPAVDIDGLAVTLSTALASVDKLQVAGSRYQPVEYTESTPVKASTTAHSLKEFAQLVWDALSDLFRIREHDKAVRPMLPPEREYFLRENLRLQLAAARLALLRNEPVQYRSALKTTADWLTAHFDTEKPAVQQLDKQLRDIATVNIAPTLPDISDSLRVLRQQMQLSEQQPVLPVVPEKQPADSQAEATADQSEAAGATP
jgi:uroporphyrin-3 C-methyltransferase